MNDIVFKFEIEIRSGNTTTAKYYSDGQNFYNADQTAATISGLSLAFGTSENDKKKVYVSGISGTTTSVYITDYGYGYELAIGNSDITKFSVGTWEYDNGDGLIGSGISAGYYIAQDGSIKYSSALSNGLYFSSFSNLKLPGNKTIDATNWKDYFEFDGMAINVKDASFASLNADVTIGGNGTNNFYFKFDNNSISGAATYTDAYWSKDDTGTLTFYGESYAGNGYRVSDNGKSLIKEATGGTSLFSIAGLSESAYSNLFSGGTTIAGDSFFGIAVQQGGNYWVTISESDLLDESAEKSTITFSDATGGPNYTFKVDGYIQDLVTTGETGTNTVAASWSSATTAISGDSTYIYTSAYVSAAYATLSNNTLTYYAQTQAKKFNIVGLLGGLLNNNTLNNVTITPNENNFDVTLYNGSTNNHGVTIENKSGGTYDINFILNGIQTAQVSSNASKQDLGNGSVKFTTASINPGYLAAGEKVLYYSEALTGASFTIEGLNQNLSSFDFNNNGTITAMLDKATVNVGSVVAHVDDDKTTYLVSLTSDAINTSQEGYSGIKISSESNIYFDLSLAGQSMWSTASDPTLTDNGGGSYVYTAGYSAGFTKTADTAGKLEYSYNPTAGADGFTLTGAAAGLSTATNVLNYVEISSEEDLKKYVKNNCLSSGYYKIIKSFEMTSSLSIDENTQVVIDVANDVTISSSSTGTYNE